MTSFKLALAVAAAGLCLAATAAQAAIIVDTGAPGVGVSDANWNLQSDQWLAARFEVSAATTITDLAGYMFAYAAPGTFTVALRADGETPGAELYSGSATAKLPFAFYGVHGVSWLVGPGTYWVAFEVRAGDTMAGYMPDNAPFALADEAYTELGDYYRYDDLDLGVRISGESAAAPEPGTWALLILGFAGAGAALRRRSAFRATSAS